MKIESHDKSVDDLLKGNIFLIPRFQREYSWESDHVTAFWNDIIENFNSSYFIGAMVVYKVGRSTLAVVDGQQRLTTITILLCAIRDSFSKLGREDLSDGLQAYIEQKDKENKTVYVLKTETSFPYLQEEVLKNSEPELDIEIGREEEAIERAFSIFKNQISEKIQTYLSNKEQTPDANNNDAIEWLSQLRDTVFDLNLITVTLDNEDDAYLIFETLNTRGKDLALADLLRNHFSKFLRPSGEVDYAKIKWKSILDTIKSSPVPLDPDTFIVHSWQSRYDFATKAKVFQKVKDRINKKNSRSHIDRFVSDADQWRSMFDTEYLWSVEEKEAARSLEALRTFKVVQPAPGILALIRSYKDNIIKYRVLKNALQCIEKFHFSFNAITSSRSSGGISGMYSSFGRAVFDASDSNSVGIAINDLIKKLKEREVAALEFEAGFAEQAVYTKKLSSQKALVQYILRRVSIHENQPSIGHSDELTIEHLLPQASISDEDAERTVGQIGNLILVDQDTNNDLSTKSWADKKAILTERGYKIPKILLDAPVLSQEILSLNTKRISDLSRTEIWKI